MLTVGWLGHATVVIDVGGQRLLTDPLLRRHAGWLRRSTPPPDPTAWAGTTAVLVSHLHDDHAEPASLRMLPTEVPVLAAPANARWLARRGLSVVPLGEEWVTVGDVEVRAVPADHAARPMPHRPNAAIGHLLRWTGERGRVAVWCAGDTAMLPDFARLPEQAGVDRLDLAVVPIWGWGPRLSGGHLHPADAAQACAMTGARHALAVHWGTLHPPLLTLLGHRWMTRPHPEFARELAVRAPGTRLLDLRPGQSAVI